MKRRSFLKSAAIGATALGLDPLSLFAYNRNSIGVQLYTVRDLMAKKPLETLKAVAAIGYKEVELAGYDKGLFYGMKPAEFRKVLDDLGLKATSGHHGYSEADFDQCVAASASIGQKFYTLPVPTLPAKKGVDFLHTMDDTTEADWIAMAEKFNQLGKKTLAAGLRLCYHNHNFEFKTFKNGKTGYELLLEHTDPKLANFEMDIYWITKAGKQPEDFFKRYPGRFKLWHVKDMDSGPEQHFAEVGTGTINFKKIFSEAKLAGMEHFFVEQDQTFKHQPLESLKISFANLKKIA